MSGIDGTGLGLAVSRSLIEAMGGTIAAILSADATRDRAQFLAAGTQAYLTKPIDLRRLLEIFDQFLAVERERVPVSAE